MSLTLFVFVVSSVCADNNHVRTWTVTRFRGMISTQPGSTPLTSFKILSLDDVDGHGGCSAGTEIGKKTCNAAAVQQRAHCAESVLVCLCYGVRGHHMISVCSRFQVRTEKETTSRCSSRESYRTPTNST